MPTLEARREALQLLGKQATGCVACRLCESRTQVVFGDGDSAADMMLIGEAPGFHEDQQGLPFVGAAGQLLSRLLSEIGLPRDQVYIANVLKCRPPGNRDPREDEVQACKGYLAQQVKLVDPLVVVTLGNFSTKLLLKTESGITRVRGRVYPWWGRQLVPTFHPAAALRSGASVVGAMQADFGLAKAVLDRARAEPEQGVPNAEQLDLGLAVLE